MAHRILLVDDEENMRHMLTAIVLASLAIGFDFTAGLINIVNFGYAAIMGVGAYTSAILAERIGLSPSPCLRRVRSLEEAGVIAGYRAALAALCCVEAGHQVALMAPTELLAEALSSAPPPNPELLQRVQDPRQKQFRIRGDRKQLLRAVVALFEQIECGTPVLITAGQDA